MLAVRKPAAPTREALAAFGVDPSGPCRLLSGGQGRTWLVGDMVLKPVDDVDEHAWVCDTFDAWPAGAGVRVPRPRRAEDGTWCTGGWGAHELVTGNTLSMAREGDAIRAAAETFHDICASLPRPSLLDRRNDPWAHGDRVAWEGLPADGSATTVRLVDVARAAYRPVEQRDQVVHGDIGGNVLGGPGLVPAVIDFPPYWRPRGWALAVAAVDALCWEGVQPALLDDWSDIPDWTQLLLRAFVYRAATVGRTEALGTNRESPAAHAAAVEQVLDRLLERAAGAA